MSSESPLRAERESQIVRIDDHTIALGFDPDGELWFVRASSVPGLEGTASTRDELVAALPVLIRDAILP